MDPTTILAEASSAIKTTADSTVDLVGSIPDLEIRIPNSEWSIREAAVHLVNVADLNTDIAAGMPSPIRTLDKRVHAAEMARRIADIPETDPGRLARLITDAVDRFHGITAGRPGDQMAVHHCGLRIDLAGVAGIMLGELLLHGYDMARAAGRPWPIASEYAQLVLYAYGPGFAIVVNQQNARGHTAGYGIDLRGATSFIVRFVDGEYRLEPPASGPVDCTISADPVAFLMVGTGRLSRWEAIALGLLSAGGDRPELAVGFPDLFAYP